MVDASREIFITGIGIVSCLGEGEDLHWQRLNQPPPPPDSTSFAPYFVHRLVRLDLDKQIPKKSDQRQMEVWQRIGVYAAGLALDSAKVKSDAGVLGRIDMIVAAGGGERDEAVDLNILAGLSTAERPEVFLNERLMSDLRPTLFLAQLSNLMAGNISIVHGVTGSSRTFMGEESAGIDAVRIACSRIAAGQSEIALVGGAFNAEHYNPVLIHSAGGFAWKDSFAPVWERSERGGGMVVGSMGAFLVLEARDHAHSREARPLARLTTVLSERSRRQPGAVTASLARLWRKLAPKEQVAVISGATGAEPATSEERAWLASLAGVPVRATGTHLGHGLEPQFVMNIALAALALGHRTLFPPTDRSGVEQPVASPLNQIVVTGVGHGRGEGMALVEAIQ